MLLREYSARDLVVSISTGLIVKPLTGLSDADDAVMVELSEDVFQDPDMDLYGGGTHVLNLNASGTVTIKLKQSARFDIDLINGIAVAKKPVPFITGADLSTTGSSFRAVSCALSKPPAWTKGKRPAELEVVFKAIQIEITHAGQRPAI